LLIIKKKKKKERERERLEEKDRKESGKKKIHNYVLPKFQTAIFLLILI
jgi:hypothetical protein